MKINRNYTLEEDVIKKLEDIQNKSALIEKLLREHFELSEVRTVADVDKEIKLLEAKQRHEKEIEVINASKWIRQENRQVKSPKTSY